MILRSSQRQRAVAELKKMVARSGEAIRFPFPHPFEPLMKHLGERLMQASDEGIALLEAESSPWVAPSAIPANRESATSVAHVLEDEVKHREDITIRRLLAVQGTLLGDFDTVCRHLERVTASDLGELPWLVGAALWVQWGSGQVIADQLKDVLLRVRARHPGFAAHLASLRAGPPGAAQEAASIIERLLADPAATLPSPGERA